MPERVLQSIHQGQTWKSTSASKINRPTPARQLPTKHTVVSRLASKASKAHFTQLLNFVEQNGHALVPRYFPANASLATWVSSQRAAYRCEQNGKQGKDSPIASRISPAQMGSFGMLGRIGAMLTGRHSFPTSWILWKRMGMRWSRVSTLQIQRLALGFRTRCFPALRYERATYASCFEAARLAFDPAHPSMPCVGFAPTTQMAGLRQAASSTTSSLLLLRRTLWLLVFVRCWKGRDGVCEFVSS